MIAVQTAALTTALAIAPLVQPEGRPKIDTSGMRMEIALQRGVGYLTAAQSPEGAWMAFDKPHPAVTALAVAALAENPTIGRAHSSVRRGLDFVLKFVQPDGGIYAPDEGMQNYHTSVALMALAAVNDPQHAKTLKNAQEFLKKLQWDEGESHEANSPWYGGAGYGKSKRPDLSNTQLMLEALRQSGLPADDPTYQKALVFISRSQMLDSANDQPLADGAADGGFIYTPANDGESKAGTEVIGDKPRLRSYGSMTYAGFKSLLYAQVDRDDARVKAALEWIRRHYSLEQNPNMPAEQAKEGLYYYYHVFAKAMQAWGQDTITDAQGVPHSWRSDLRMTLIKQQNPDGSWVNTADRWYEGNPHLVTAYALLALQATMTPPAPSPTKDTTATPAGGKSP